METRPEARGTGLITLSKEILERVDRVLDYHRATKHTPDSVRALKPQNMLADQPAPIRTFPGRPKVILPTGLLDMAVAALSLMREGLAALPDSHVQPPQDLKTIATWLYMAAGVSAERKIGSVKYRLRTYPSGSALYPSEIYLAAFAIDGLKPGLYSFNPWEFSLTELRDGPETLAQIKRGRPDLAFLKSVPAALLISSIYCRSAFKYRARGFRVAAQDAGHLIANLVAAANGLGIQTMTRLKMNDNTMRELIGIAYEPDFGSFEAVQAMVVWADSATSPIDQTASGPGAAPLGVLPPIERTPLSPSAVSYGSIVAAHYDCVAPGVPLRDIRPPFTELSPLPPTHPLQEMTIVDDLFGGPSIRQVLLGRRSSRDFQRRGISRDRFLAVNLSAFRTGTFLPLHPDGPQPGLIRPFWVIHEIAGITPGVWYYNPRTDRWGLLKPGDFRAHSRMMCLEQPKCGNAAAVCLMTANLHAVMQGSGPDAYRLAQLEAGIAGQRLSLAAGACGIGSCGIGSFYDDEIRQFLGLQQGAWEPLYVTALGVTAAVTELPAHPGLGIG
jgi:SagB-type dehydrogenase family enzyme